MARKERSALRKTGFPFFGHFKTPSAISGINQYPPWKSSVSIPGLGSQSVARLADPKNDTPSLSSSPLFSEDQPWALPELENTHAEVSNQIKFSSFNVTAFWACILFSASSN
ncbi:MAG: hypothetical protein ABIK28_14825, partial [Planctomycetota bacterium]